MSAGLMEQLSRLRQETSRTVTGYEDVLDDLLTGLLARGHVLLEGVPGIAKTTLAKTFATTSGLAFRRVQFTQDLLPADITGHYFFDQKTREFELRKGPVFANFLLADEINRAPPKTQSALLEAMEERQVTIEGRTFGLESPFIVVATMNPIDMESVYHLPIAQLDRFMIRTRMGYLSASRERDMLIEMAAEEQAVFPILDAKTIIEAQQATQRVHVSQEIVHYVHALGLATRAHPLVTLGASPRALGQLIQASRAVALLSGRGHVLPDDVKRTVSKVFNHRIILSLDAEIEAQSTEGIVQGILAQVEVPKAPVPR